MNVTLGGLFLVLLIHGALSHGIHPVPRYRVQTIVIDAGHGGKDPGAHGEIAAEKAITLGIAKKLTSRIAHSLKSIHVVMTRSSDTFVQLDKRASIAAGHKSSLFIAIHCNASKDKTVKGSETYAIGLGAYKENLEVAERENSVILLEKNYKETYHGFDPKSAASYIIFSMVQGHTVRKSLHLATCIETQFEKMGRISRGVKQAGFLVLRKTAMPSVLVETGFITNPSEEKMLRSEKGQSAVANQIYIGLLHYLKIL